MKKIILAFSFLISVSTAVFAQCSSWIEASSVLPFRTPITIPDYQWSITTDSNNNVYSTGSFVDTISFDNDTLIDTRHFNDYINKFNSNGVIQWAIQFETDEHGSLYAYQKNGALYVAGTYGDTLILDAKKGTMLTAIPGTTNFFMLKLDLDGNILWAKSYAGNFDGVVDVFSITVNDNNEVYFTGEFSDTATFGSTVLVSNTNSYEECTFLTKTDSSGNVKWAIQSASSSSTGTGGVGVTTDNNKNIIVSGSFVGKLTFGTQTVNSIPNGDSYIAKFDTLGNCEWINAQGILRIYGVVTDPLGNIYSSGILWDTITINGTKLKPDNGVDCYAKYTPAGNLVWIKQAGDSDIMGYQQYPSSLVIDASNHLWMTGYENGPANFGSYHLAASGSIYIAEIDTGGTILNVIGTEGLANSNDLVYDLGNTSTLDGEGNLYVSCYSEFTTMTIGGTTITGSSAIDSGYNEGTVVLKYCTSTAGIPQLQAINNQLSIYPNPTGGEINIASTKTIDDLKAFNLLGQLVYESQPKQMQVAFELKYEGMYFVTVTSGNGVSTSKVIVSR